jgi:CRISPR system Cascade subunit CasB
MGCDEKMRVIEASEKIKSCVDFKVNSLQKNYLAGRPSARASLARLRRINTSDEQSWMIVGEEVFSDIPDLESGQKFEEKELGSIRSALGFYALLQQSKGYPVADDSIDASFGRACRKIAVDDNHGAKGVKRRLAVIEAAHDFQGVQFGVRSLVQLMHASDEHIQLNFGLLAADFFKIQFEGFRPSVFERWALDYYRSIPEQTR